MNPQRFREKTGYSMDMSKKVLRDESLLKFLDFEPSDGPVSLEERVHDMEVILRELIYDLYPSRPTHNYVTNELIDWAAE